jgi:hypothetical protein
MGSGDRVALVVVCLVVVAGCSALPGGPSDREPTETVTPVPVTTPTPAASTQPGDLPPGVFANGSVDVEHLVDAHESYLADRSYTWQLRYSVAGADILRNNFTRRVTVGQERFLVEQTTPAVSRNQTLYVDDKARLRTTQRGQEEFTWVDEPQGSQSYAFAGDVVERFLAGVSVDVSVVERGGRTYYRLYTDGNDIPNSLTRFGVAARNYTMTAYVTPQGFVRTVVVDYNLGEEYDNRRVTSRYDYSAVGSTTVAEPDWVTRMTSTPAAATTPPPVRTAGPDRTPETPAPTENATATRGQS